MLNSTLARSFQGRDVRIKTEDGTPYFHGNDTCRAVGISVKTKAAKHALDSLASDERKQFPVEVEGTGIAVGNVYEEDHVFVSEPGVYRLIFRSQDPMAEKFRHWVFHEVLPEIRESGMYVGEDAFEGLPVREQLDGRSIKHYVTRSDVYTQVRSVVREVFDKRRTDHIPAETMAEHKDLPGIDLETGEDLRDQWVTLEGLYFWLFRATPSGTTAFAQEYGPKLRERVRNLRLASSDEESESLPDTSHLSDESRVLLEEMEKRINEMEPVGTIGGDGELEEMSDKLDNIESSVTGGHRSAYKDWSRSDKREEINALVNNDYKRFGHIYDRVERHTGTHPREEADNDASSVLKGVSDNTLSWILHFADAMYAAEA